MEEGRDKTLIVLCTLRLGAVDISQSTHLFANRWELKRTQPAVGNFQGSGSTAF